MPKFVAALGLGAFVIFAWVATGYITPHYVVDVDAHVTTYRKHCDSIVQAFLGAKEHKRLTIDQYMDMTQRLKSCNQTAETPKAG